MANNEPIDVSPGFGAFIVAFFGSGLIVAGFIFSIFFWPVGVLLFILGGLAILGSPIVWYGIRKKRRDEKASEV